MAVTNTDIHFFKSSTGDSVGGSISATEITGAALNNFWQNVTDTERGDGGTHIKKWFLENSSGTDSLIRPSVYIFQMPTYTTEAIGVGFDDSDDDDNDQGIMTAFAANAKVALISDGSDTRTCRIVGRNSVGDPFTEDVVLNGTTEVLSVTTWSAVYAVKVSALSGSRSVTIKQGTVGTTRGTIPVNRLTCWLWLSPTTKAAGITLLNVSPGAIVGFWDKLTWSAGIGSIRPTQSVIGVEETA